MHEEVIKNYLTPSHPTAFSGVSNVYNYYKKHSPEIKLTHKKIEKILSEIESYTRHKESKSLQRNPTFIYYRRQQMQIDLVDVKHLKQYNRGYGYLLTCIDVFTRYAFCQPLKTKTSASTLEAFKIILKQAVDLPRTIACDRGGEFRSAIFLGFCRKKNILVVHTDTSIHSAYVERFNRTLQGITYKYMTANETYTYVDVIPDLLQSYNNRVHRMIGVTPSEAEKPQHHMAIREKNEKRFMKIKRKKPKYSVGQHVRITLLKHKFSRGYNPQQTEEIFKIKSVSTTLPIPLYKLENFDSNETIEGDFYEFELTPVVKETFAIEKILKKKKVKGQQHILVKWRGYKEPSWIPESNLV